MKSTTIVAAGAALLLLSGCKHHEKHKISDADAAKVADDFIATLKSNDVAKIDALYAPDAVSVDPVATQIAVGSEAIHKFNAGYVAMKYDKVEVTDRHIQAPDGDDVIVTGKAAVSHSANPGEKPQEFRFTEVFHKARGDDAGFKIIAEHVSFAAPESAPSATAPAKP